MANKPETVEEYINDLPENRKNVVTKLRAVILENLPKGFIEEMSYGMLGYVVPHSIYPKGYHVNPKLPLPFINLASQKNHIGFYHLGIYSDPELMDWFVTEYRKICKYKLDMGKSCIRFKKMTDIPYDLIGKLVTKISVENWITTYEKSVYKKKK